MTLLLLQLINIFLSIIHTTHARWGEKLIILCYRYTMLQSSQTTMNIQPFRVTINLDLAPEVRYAELVTHFNVPKISSEIGAMFDEMIDKTTLKKLLSTIVNHNLDKAMYLDEITYWAQTFNMDRYKVLLLQLLYEICSGCTSIVTNCDGQPTLIRTMDWDMSILKEMTYQATFTKNGAYLYDAVCWVGHVGIFTAKNRNMAVSINYRRVNDFGLKTIYHNFINTINGHFPVSYLLRDVFENYTNNNNAIDRLTRSNLISPVYYTVCLFDAGGIVITRFPTSYSLRNGETVFQTNCDDNSSDNENILLSHERTTFLNGCLPTIRTLQSISGLKQYPIINHETVYLAIMNRNVFDTFV